jgi:tetratricopeptide (TPR) repeat protein
MDFFISYNKADREWAVSIAYWLEEAGYSTVVQAWDFKPGGNFVLDMHRASMEAERTIAVLSPDYLNALYTQPEWTAAVAADPTGEQGLLLLVRVRECELKGLLRPFVYVDLVGLGEEAAKAALVAAAARKRAKPTTAPAFPGGPPAFPGATPWRSGLPTTEAPAHISNVPPRNLCFTGREKLLGQLHEELTRGGRVALRGLPGVGKTQAAIEYAHQRRDDYRAALWVTAATREGLVAGFCAMARLLSLPEKDEQDQNLIVAAVRRWLQDNSNWLLILDNADDLAMTREFLPSGAQGHVLFTTRASATGGIAHGIEIDEMPPEEGACLLLLRAKLLGPGAPWEEAEAEDREAALAIARKVGGLPLALDQAGAFIEARSSTPAEYLALYETEGAILRDKRGEGGTHDHESVSTTFSLAFRIVEDANHAAADLLRLCAFLAPDAIPEEIISSGAPDLGDPLGSAAAQPLARSEAMGEAGRFSLLDRDRRARTLSIHRLVQDVLKDHMDAEEQHLWAERAVRAVSLTFPAPDFRNWSACSRLMTQAQACADLIERWEIEFPEAGDLLQSAGNCLRDRGQYAAAEPLFRQALTLREKLLGSQHPAVASSLNNWAILYRRQGRYAEAEPLFQQALAIREAALGPEHPDVATSLNNLANVCHDEGRMGEAEALFQRALAIREQTLGPEHPDVATSLSNLAILRGDQGRYSDAEALYRRALAIREKVLGPEHPDVGQTLNNLAMLYHSQERHDEAGLLYLRALVIQEQSLGPEHPNVATSLYNLAELHMEQERAREAEPLYLRALAIWEQALGPTHLDVADTLYSLAKLYNAQGRGAQAEPLLLRALSIREKILGPDHADTGEIRELLTLLQQGPVSKVA